MYRSIALTLCCLLTPLAAYAQPASRPVASTPVASTPVVTTPPPHAEAPRPPAPHPAADPFGAGIRFNLTKDGKSWVRFLAWTQVWLRMIHNNPGTMVGGSEKDVDFDVMIRRARLMVIAQLTSRVLLLTHFGIDNQTFRNNEFDEPAKQPSFFIHDAWVQFEVLPTYLYAGGGLHYWNGISRMTSASTLNFLAVDAPIINWPNINSQDQFGRWLGVFVKGKLGAIDYRFSVNRPFAKGGTDAPSGTTAELDINADTWATQGYVSYQFLDREANTVPFTVGTYLGKKRVFNLGAGFLYQPKALHALDASGQRETHDMVMLGVDAFADLPFGGLGALTAYAAFWHYDMGPDRVVVSGIGNYAKPGNAYPLFGTGEHVYLQVGYLLPFGIKLQPYTTFLFSKYKAYDDAALVFEAGLNWYLIGQHAKLTLHYRARPLFDGKASDGHLSEVILQAAVFI